MNDERAIRRHPVCWGCFKHCTAPYKYAELSLVAWVAAGGPVAWLSETRPINPQPELLAELMQPVEPTSVLVRTQQPPGEGKAVSAAGPHATRILPRRL